MLSILLEILKSFGVTLLVTVGSFTMTFVMKKIFIVFARCMSPKKKK